MKQSKSEIGYNLALGAAVVAMKSRQAALAALVMTEEEMRIMKKAEMGKCRLKRIKRLAEKCKNETELEAMVRREVNPFPTLESYQLRIKKEQAALNKKNSANQGKIMNNLEPIGALDHNGFNPTQRNVAVAEFDLSRELSERGTFVMLGFEQLDLAVHSEAVKFLERFPDRTKFMTPGIMAFLANSLSTAAEIAQADLGFKDPLNHSSITQIEKCIHILAFALYDMHEAAPTT